MNHRRLTRGVEFVEVRALSKKNNALELVKRAFVNNFELCSMKYKSPEFIEKFTCTITKSTGPPVVPAMTGMNLIDSARARLGCLVRFFPQLCGIQHSVALIRVVVVVMALLQLAILEPRRM
jgi:hypothetical protein